MMNLKGFGGKHLYLKLGYNHGIFVEELSKTTDILRIAEFLLGFERCIFRYK
jgi:hypothetical protein